MEGKDTSKNTSNPLTVSVEVSSSSRPVASSIDSTTVTRRISFPSEVMMRKVDQGTEFVDSIESHGLADGRASRVRKVLPQAIERERKIELRWHHLLFHKIWRDGSCCAKILDPIEMPILKPECEWVGELPWPNGVNTQGLFKDSWNFCVFVYSLPQAKYDARKCFFIQFLLGIIKVIGIRLVSHIALRVSQIADDGLTPKDSDWAYVWIVLSVITFLAMLRSRLYYQFQNDVPLAAIRFHFRHVFQRRLLRLHRNFKANKLDRSAGQVHAGARQTPSSCVQIQDTCIDDAIIKVWGSSFMIPYYAAYTLTTVVSGIYHRDKDGYTINILYAGTTIVNYLLVILVFSLYRNPVEELAQLGFLWRLRFGSLVASTVKRVMKSDIIESNEDLDKKAKLVAEAAFVYRKRSFHFFFMKLVFEETAHGLAFVIYYGAFAYLCVVTMNPDYIDFDGNIFAAGMALIMAGKVETGRLIDTISTLVTGHRSLLALADIINEKDNPDKLKF